MLQPSTVRGFGALHATSGDAANCRQVLAGGERHGGWEAPEWAFDSTRSTKA